MHTQALENPHWPVAEPEPLELMRAIQRGERPAFEKLSHLYYADLHSLLSWLTPRADQVDDLACEVLLSCWHCAAGFQSDSAVQIWLWKLAYPVIVREAAASLKERQLEPERPTAAPLTNSRRADLAGALLMLPIEERTTLVLTFHMRCSREEIANITQSSADVVSRRMQQALRVLRAKGWPWSAQPN